MTTPGVYSNPFAESKDLNPSDRLAYEEGHDADLYDHSANRLEKASDVDDAAKSSRRSASIPPDDGANGIAKHPSEQSIDVTDTEKGDNKAAEENRDKYDVWWEEPENQDPHNPMNWPAWKKWGNIGVLSLITLITLVSSPLKLWVG